MKNLIVLILMIGLAGLSLVACAACANISLKIYHPIAGSLPPNVGYNDCSASEMWKCYYPPGIVIAVW
jgi:hypothetical protein